MTAQEHDNSEAPPPLIKSVALFLDFDGTLVDFAPQPSQVTVSTRLPGLLHLLYQRLDGGLAIITGRRLKEIDALLAPTILPGAGVHGAELRFFGRTPSRIRRVRLISKLAQELSESFASDARLLIEDKYAAVALHFRRAPDRASECIEAMRSIATSLNLEVIVGDMVVEARVPGIGKGEALREFSRRSPFKDRPPVFIGDSAFDEEGFAAADELGGYGVKVGGGRTLARYRFRDVVRVHQWLDSSLVSSTGP